MLNTLPLLLLLGQTPAPAVTPVTSPVEIKRKLTAGEETSYDFCCAYLTHPDKPDAVPNSQIATWIAKYKIDSVKSPAEGALDALVSGFTIDGTNTTKYKRTHPDKTTHWVLDSRGRLKPTTAEGAQDTNGGWFVWESIALPDKAVSTGDTWTMTFPREAVLHSGEEVPVKLLGSVKYSNHDAWALAVDCRDTPFSKTLKGKTPDGKEVTVISSGVGSMHIELYVDKETGKYLFAEERLHTVQTDAIEGAPKPSPYVADFTATMRVREFDAARSRARS